MTTIIIDEPNTHNVDQLWVFLSVDENGEGIVAGYLAGFGWHPLVTSEARMIGNMREIAKDVLATKPVRLVRFTRAEIVEELTR